MKIAICDDDCRELSRLSEILNSYRQEKKADVTYLTFSDAMSLLDAVGKGGFDLILLDILMPLLNGIEAAHELRLIDEHVKIIFLTSSPEFALESYEVNAYNYLLKPFNRKALFPILDKLFDELQMPEEGLTLRFQNCISHILFSKLEYVEILNKTLYFHLSDNSVRALAASLTEYESILLSHYEFIKVHRSFIANLHKIQELSPGKIRTHSGKVIPVSRRLYPKVRDSYIKYLFREKGIE